MLFAVSIGSHGAGEERYTLYVPFVLSRGHDIGLKEPVNFPLLAYTARLEKLHHLYALSVSPFAQPEQARNYIDCIKASLMWLSLSHRVGIHCPKELSDIRVFEKPIRISEKSDLKSLIDTVGWEASDGEYDASHIVVRHEHKKLLRWEMGNMTVRVGMGAKNVISCLSEAVNFPYLEQIGGSLRLQLAIELYGASCFELTENAQLITLVTSLESLTPDVAVSDCVKNCLREARDLVKKNRDIYTKRSAHWNDMNQLLMRLDRLGLQSIRSSLQTYISTIVEETGEFGDPDAVANRLRQIYDVRSRLLHDGIAKRTDVGYALGFLRDFVPKLLTALFRAEAQKMKVS